jgi:hypothetical protein
MVRMAFSRSALRFSSVEWIIRVTSSEIGHIVVTRPLCSPYDFERNRQLPTSEQLLHNSTIKKLGQKNGVQLFLANPQRRQRCESASLRLERLFWSLDGLLLCRARRSMLCRSHSGHGPALGKLAGRTQAGSG